MEIETDTPQDMEMPTPCTCGRWVELNDMNTCDICNNLYCRECCERPWGYCINCGSDDEDEE